MPGARLASVRTGDSAETLAEYLLGRISFVTKVPWEQDTGHDLLCTLIERLGKLAKTGPFFTVQVKANHRQITYAKKHEVEWIKGQENPFLVGIANVRKQTLELYSTWNMLNAFLHRGTPKVTLVPGEPKRANEHIIIAEDLSSTTVYLGKPIVTLSATDKNSDVEDISNAKIIREWVSFDRENIIRKAAKMYWVVGPKHYYTSQSIAGVPKEIRFHYNATNFPDCVDNLVRACTAMLCVMRQFERYDSEWIKLKTDIQKLLVANRSFLTPLHKQILRTMVGLDVR